MYVPCFYIPPRQADHFEGPFLNASYFAIAERLQTPITSVVVISGYNLLAAGASGPLYCAASRRWGKRPCFILSTLFNIVGTAVGESKASFNCLLAARIIQGFSTSAFESLIISAVGDMYFVHERGLRISTITFILYAASGLASIICGQVFDKVGWLWLFHLFQIFVVLQFVLMFFFCPETTYIRDHRYDTDTQVDEKLEEVAHMEEAARSQEKAAQTAQMEPIEAPLPRRQKKTFVQELAVFSGTYSRDNVIKQVFGPFLSLLNIAACYTIVTAGLLSAFYVGASSIVYLGAGPFVGGMLGCLAVSLTSDWIAKRMTRLNAGV
jgi:MFS family permease